MEVLSRARGQENLFSLYRHLTNATTAGRDGRGKYASRRHHSPGPRPSSRSRRTRMRNRGLSRFRRQRRRGSFVSR